MGTTPGLRAADLPPIPMGTLVGGLSRLLMRRPPIGDICRYLVLSVDWASDASGAVVLQSQDDGFLELKGSFGYPRELVDTYSRLSLFDEGPLSRAARSREHVYVSSPEVLGDGGWRRTDSFPSPSGDPGSSFLAFPIVSDLGAIGVIGLTFVRDVDDPQQHLSVMDLVASVVGVYLEAQRDRQPMERGTGRFVEDSERVVGIFEREDVDTSPLSARQWRVLRMMTKKMTNREIALALDYSVSTIRLDTMSIFRFLGVNDRREAVNEARRRGLVDAG